MKLQGKYAKCEKIIQIFIDGVQQYTNSCHIKNDFTGSAFLPIHPQSFMKVEVPVACPPMIEDRSCAQSHQPDIIVSY